MRAWCHEFAERLFGNAGAVDSQRGVAAMSGAVNTRTHGVAPSPGSWLDAAKADDEDAPIIRCKSKLYIERKVLINEAGFLGAYETPFETTFVPGALQQFEKIGGGI